MNWYRATLNAISTTLVKRRNVDSQRIFGVVMVVFYNFKFCSINRPNSVVKVMFLNESIICSFLDSHFEYDDHCRANERLKNYCNLCICLFNVYNLGYSPRITCYSKLGGSGNSEVNNGRRLRLGSV